jgi:hypothetical protein
VHKEISRDFACLGAVISAETLGERDETRCFAPLEAKFPATEQGRNRERAGKLTGKEQGAYREEQGCNEGNEDSSR